MQRKRTIEYVFFGWKFEVKRVKAGELVSWGRNFIAKREELKLSKKTFILPAAGTLTMMWMFVWHPFICKEFDFYNW